MDALSTDRRNPESARPAARQHPVAGHRNVQRLNMIRIPDDEFDKLVDDEFNGLPAEMVKGVENVAILIEDQPTGQRPRLFGLYSGHPITKRSEYGFGELPDRITLFRNNLEESCADLNELRARVRVTLVHEIGHYFGLDDEELEKLGWA